MINKYKIALLIIFLFQLLTLTVFHALDNTQFAADDSWHLASSLHFYQEMTGESKVLDNQVINERYIRYPHLYHAVAAPLWLFGQDALIYVNVLFMALGLWFIYLLGKELYSERVGAIAAFLLTMYPMFFGLSRRFMLDFPVICLTIPTIYCLIKFSKTKQWLYLAYTASFFLLGVLTKQTFLVIMLVPVLIGVFTTLYKKLDKKHFKIVVLSSVGAAVLGFIAYMFAYSGFYLFNIILGHSRNSTVHTLVEVLGYTTYNLLTVGLLILFLYALTKSNSMQYKWIFGTWIIVPLLFFSWSDFLSAGRYFAGILPAFALITAYGLRAASRVLLIVVVVLGVILYTDISFNPQENNVEILDTTVYTNDIFWFNSPKKEDWRHDEILSAIEPGNCLSVGAWYPNLNVYTLALHGFTNDIDVTVKRTCRTPAYYLTVDGNYDFSEGPTRIETKSVNQFLRFQNQTEVVATYDLPGDLEGTLHKLTVFKLKILDD